MIIEGPDPHDVPSATYEIVCALLRITDGTGSPARVLLIES